MHRIDGAGHVGNMWVGEDLETNRPPTLITAEWMNDVQESLCKIVEESGFELSKGDFSQLFLAMNALYGLFYRPEVGAVQRPMREKGMETISLDDFGVPYDGLNDPTTLINVAISVAAVQRKQLIIPPRLYIIHPATQKQDEAGQNLCAFPMTSHMHIFAEDGAIFRIADGVSTDLNPVRHSMFFSNDFLQDISIEGLDMDMNGQANLISPQRGELIYNRFTNAPIICSGTPNGIAAGANNVHLSWNTFRNLAGVSGIVLSQSNTPGVALSDNWLIDNNQFINVGLDCDDHSTAYLTGTNIKFINNRLRNPQMFNSATRTGGLVAVEIHGSNTVCSGNTIDGYFQGFWVSVNMTEAATRNISVTNNAARVSGTFVDFWSHNLLPYGDNEGDIEQVGIRHNFIEITDDPALIDVKSFIKFGAGRQPTLVDFSENICRSYAISDECVLALLIVGSNQQRKADQIRIKNNLGANVCAGFVTFFNGDGATSTTQNVGRVEYEANDLGYLVASPSGIYPSVDVFLYGPQPGKIESLLVGGLQMPLTPILTDSAEGGRATLFGKAIVSVPVVWNGVTLGDGQSKSRISIDSNAGFADVNLALTSGGTTTFAGQIYPRIDALTADMSGTATVTHLKTGLAELVPAIIYDTAHWISLLAPGGGGFDSSRTQDGISNLYVSARFPTRSVEI